MQKSIIKLWPLIIFTFALGIRFIFLSQFQDNPFFQTDVKGVDPSLYHEWAKDLAQGYWPGYKLLYGHPFYPYIVSFFYRFWAVDSYSVIVMQLALGALSCVFIYLITKRIFCYQAGIVSSFIAALYGPFLFYEGLMMPTALAIFLNMAALLMLFNILDFLPHQRDPANGTNQRRTFLAGLLLGCSLITNSGIAPFIILAAAWIFFVLKKNRQQAAAHIMCFLFAVLLPVLMMSFKHFVAEGRYDSFGAHGGINFYVGNNPESTGTFRAPLGFTPNAQGLSEDSAKYAAKALGRELSAAEVSKFWYGRAFLYIKSNPVLWIKLLFRKALLFFNNVELGDVADYYFAKGSSWILRFNPFSFSLIAALGILGIALARRSFQGSFLLYTGIFSFMFSCVLFFVNSRYRLSVVPYLVPFAGFAVWSIWNRLKSLDFRHLAAYILVFLVFFIFSNIKIIAADNFTPMYNLAVIYEKNGSYDKAIDVSEKLLKQKWELPMVHFNLGVCFYQKKMAAEAQKEFQETLKFNPNDKDSHFNLGIIYYENKNYKDALQEFESSIRGSDKDIASYYWIGKIYKEWRDYNKALESYKQALKIGPDVLEIKKAVEEVKNLQKGKK